MKNLFKQSLISLVTGLVFTASLVIGSYAVDAVLQEPETDSTKRVSNPPNIEVINHEIVTGSPRLTITGVAQNNSEFDYELIRLEALVYIDSYQINRCLGSKGKISNLLVGESRQFEVECSHTAGSGIPKNLSYKLSVSSGRRIINK